MRILSSSADTTAEEASVREYLMVSTSEVVCSTSTPRDTYLRCDWDGETGGDDMETRHVNIPFILSAYDPPAVAGESGPPSGMLCPVRALADYVERTRSVRTTDQLFVSLDHGHDYDSIPPGWQANAGICGGTFNTSCPGCRLPFRGLCRDPHSTLTAPASRFRAGTSPLAGQRAQKICDLDEKDGFRAHSTGQLLEKLYGTGLIPTKQNLALTEKPILPTIMISLQMAQNLMTAITSIRLCFCDYLQYLVLCGLDCTLDVYVGPEIVTDPAFLVTRNMEDFVTWVDSSKIKLHVMTYNDE
ncbi:unnamed protein product, partial [Coregonus sp. 'balchen']